MSRQRKDSPRDVGESQRKDEGFDLAWNLMVELRKETVEAQKIRAQVIGFKITLVSTAIGVVVANLDKVPGQLLVIPAFAAIFFDLLVNSYSVSVKRIGYYCLTEIEPKLKGRHRWPADSPLWEEFMNLPSSRQSLSLIGNLGLTGLAIAPAIISLVTRFDAAISIPLLVLLVAFAVYDTITFFRYRRVTERNMAKGRNNRGS